MKPTKEEMVKDLIRLRKSLIRFAMSSCHQTCGSRALTEKQHVSSCQDVRVLIMDINEKYGNFL